MYRLGFQTLITDFSLFPGVLLREIITNNIAAASGTLTPRGRKLVLYSAHDNNISALLLTLGVYNYMVPPYGTMVLMELHRIPRADRKDAVPDSIKVMDSTDIHHLTHTGSLDNLHQYGVKVSPRKKLEDRNCRHVTASGQSGPVPTVSCSQSAVSNLSMV